MKKPGRGAIIIFALAFFVMLIVTAPATLLAKVVESVSNGQLVLANASGTIWQGSATPAIRQRAGSLLALEKLHWEILLLPVLTGKLSSQFRWENNVQEKPMLVTLSMDQLELNNAVLPLTAGLLGEISPLLQPVQLSGQVYIQSEKFILTMQGVNGSAVAEWSNAGSVLSPVKPLGNYRMNLTGAGERLDIELSTISGVLLLEGKGSFTAKQGLHFQVSARASADSKGSINELLSNFGPESSPGVHTLKLMQ